MKYLNTFFAFFLITITASSQSWSPVGSGFNNTVHAVYADTINNRMYVGGDFTLSGGDTMNRVAYWDGLQWYPMGDGFDNRVMDIGEYNGEIYAVGDFQNSGTTPVNHIAKWNGTSWEDVGGGLDDWAICMYVFNNDLYVGGSFQMAGTTPCKYVARWNGTVWSTVDTNITSTSPWAVQTIYSYQNELLIGGRFTANGSIDNIARLINGVWQALGGSANGDVTGMQEINGDLYVTGFFSFVDTVNSLAFAKWNGNNWTAIYGPMSSLVTGIIEYNGNIILSGNINSFVNMGWGQLSPCIAHYNIATQTWSGVDSGCGGYINDMALMNNTLYAVGSFVSCGNTTILRAAQLDPSALSVDEIEDRTIIVFPNPANSEITFQFGDVDEYRSVVIYNCAGQVVEIHSASLNTLRISTAEFAEGIYFFNCLGENTESNGKFIIAH